jgi:hypothetical protein
MQNYITYIQYISTIRIPLGKLCYEQQFFIIIYIQNIHYTYLGVEKAHMTKRNTL